MVSHCTPSRVTPGNKHELAVYVKSSLVLAPIQSPLPSTIRNVTLMVSPALIGSSSTSLKLSGACPFISMKAQLPGPRVARPTRAKPRASARPRSAILLKSGWKRAGCSCGLSRTSHFMKTRIWHQSKLTLDCTGTKAGSMEIWPQLEWNVHVRSTQLRACMMCRVRRATSRAWTILIRAAWHVTLKLDTHKGAYIGTRETVSSAVLRPQRDVILALANDTKGRPSPEV